MLQIFILFVTLKDKTSNNENKQNPELTGHSSCIIVCRRAGPLRNHPRHGRQGNHHRPYAGYGRFRLLRLDRSLCQSAFPGLPAQCQIVRYQQELLQRMDRRAHEPGPVQGNLHLQPGHHHLPVLPAAAEGTVREKGCQGAPSGNPAEEDRGFPGLHHPAPVHHGREIPPGRCPFGQSH